MADKDRGKVFFLRLGTSKQQKDIDKCLKEGWLRISFDDEFADDSVVFGGEKPLGLKDRRKNYWDQLQHFIKAGENDTFITINKRTLYYCQPADAKVYRMDEEGNPWKGREIDDRWRVRKCNFPKTKRFTVNKISGYLSTMSNFRGTLYEVTGDAREVFFNTIDGNFPCREKLKQLLKENKQNRENKKPHLNDIIPIIRGLSPKDFEILVDLVMSRRGFLRFGDMEKNIEAIDMEYLIPEKLRSKIASADQKIIDSDPFFIPKDTDHLYVQVKGKLDNNIYQDAIEKLKGASISSDDTCIFAYHDLDDFERSNNQELPCHIKFLDAKAIAKKCRKHPEIIEWLCAVATV